MNAVDLARASIAAVVFTCGLVQVATSAPVCSGLPEPGALIARDRQVIAADPASASLAVFRNELAVEAVAIIRDARGEALQVLHLAPQTSANTVLKSGGYGLEIAIGNRWCNLDHGFLDGKSFRIVGGLSAFAGAGVKTVIKKHAADPAKINIAFEQLAVGQQDMLRVLREMKGGWTEIPANKVTNQWNTLSRQRLSFELSGITGWLQEKSDLAIAAFNGDRQSQAGLMVWLKDAMVYGPLPIMLLVFCAWILMARTKRVSRSDGGVPPVDIGGAVSGQSGGQGSANPWWYGASVANGNLSPDHHRKRLLSMCMGDAGKAQRLMDFECERSPRISDEDAAQRAIERWERDMAS